jgi:hypothetical protein
MKIYREMDNFNELSNIVWSGAVDTLNCIIINNKENELMDLLEKEFPEGASETEVNDFLWFADDYIFEYLGIEEEE